jgi:hypothetical protein
MYGMYQNEESTIPLPDDGERAANAIRHIGTNALPCLLTWLDYEPTTWRDRVDTVAEKLPAWIGESRPITRFRGTEEAAERARNAMRAFAALGSIAAPTIPELSRRANLPHSLFKGRLAMVALAYIGQDAVSALITTLSSPSQADSEWEVECIRIMGAQAFPLIPLLVQRLQSTNAIVAFQSAFMLRILKLEPNLVVPALIKTLQDPRPEVRSEAASAFAEFGVLARPALPALSNALNDPNLFVRRRATNAIARITAATLTNAPAR